MAARKITGWTLKPPAGGRVNAGHVLANGLLGCYLYTGSTNFVEDVGPFGIHGVPRGTGAGNSQGFGKFGKTNTFSNSANSGYLLVGQNDVSAPPPDHPILFKFVPPFSVSSWIFWTSSSIQAAIIGSNSGGALEFGLDTSLKVIILRQSVALMATSTGAVPLNAWTHVGMSMDAAGNWALYINGKQDSSGNTAGAFSASANWISLGTNSATEAFIGMLDITALWTRILSKQEFSQLYSDPLGLLQKPYLRLRSGIAAVVSSVSNLVPMPFYNTIHIQE